MLSHYNSFKLNKNSLMNRNLVSDKPIHTDYDWAVTPESEIIRSYSTVTDTPTEPIVGHPITVLWE